MSGRPQRKRQKTEHTDFLSSENLDFDAIEEEQEKARKRKTPKATPKKSAQQGNRTQKNHTQKRVNEKRPEWDKWLASQYKNAPETQTLLREKLFDRVHYSGVTSRRGKGANDYEYWFNATLHINENVAIVHSAYDDEGCNTSWSLSFRDKYPCLAELVYGSGSSYVRVSSEQLDLVRSLVGLTDREKISDAKFIYAIVLALPWKEGLNQVFFPKSIKYIAKKVQEKKDEFLVEKFSKRLDGVFSDVGFNW